MLAEIDDAGIQRGTIGQSIYHVLDLDQDIQSKLFGVALDRNASEDVRLWAAAIQLYRSGEDAPAALERLLSADDALGSQDVSFPAWRGIREINHFEYLVQSIIDHGYVSLF